MHVFDGLLLHQSMSMDTVRSKAVLMARKASFLGLQLYSMATMPFALDMAREGRQGIYFISSK